MNRRIISITGGRLFLTVALAFMFAGCKSDDKVPEFSVWVDRDELAYNSSGTFLNISTPEEWSASVSVTAADNENEDPENPWCTLNQVSGKGSTQAILTTSQNPNGSSRQARIKVQLVSGAVRSLTVTQKSEGEYSGGTSTSDRVQTSIPDPGWVELPVVDKSKPNCGFITHMLASDETKRNFSMLYDTVGMFAYWVAYPLHSSYIGSSGRTDAWGYDPKVPAKYQPNMNKGISPYQRGHQLPSGDRTVNKATNAQTFYYTNMTAQNGNLNMGQWGSLETKIRDWMSQCDTLYVVTGAMPGNLTHPDNDGKLMKVPEYYFKVLAKRRNNVYYTIAFKVANQSDPDPYMTWKMSVTELENITGFTFFPSIPEDVKSAIVDSQWK